MVKILQSFMSLIGVVALGYALNAIGNFFGIDPGTYMIFLLFLCALGIFYAVLPSNRGQAFTL